MSFTSRANRKNFAFGLAPQTAKGAAAVVGSARYFVAESIDIDPNRQFIHPQGTTGSQFNKDTFRHVTTAPIVNARIMGAKEFLGPILEMMAFGLSTVATAQLTEAGDTSNEFSLWTLSGVRPGFNTEYLSGVCKLYVKVLTNVIYVYRDSAKTLLVAQANAALGALTFAAQNNSGLTVTGTSTTATPTDNAGITLTVNTIAVAWSTTPSIYYTLFKDDGKKLETVSDCMLKSVKFTSESGGPLMLDCVFWGMGYTTAATGASFTASAENIYAHNGDLVMRNALDSSPVVQDPVSVDFTFDRDLERLFGTGAVPGDVYSRLIDARLTCKFEPTTEIDTMLALVNTFDSIDLKFTSNSKLLSITFDKVTLSNPKYPGFMNGDTGQVDLEWLITEETAASPSAPIVITYQP